MDRDTEYETIGHIVGLKLLDDFKKKIITHEQYTRLSRQMSATFNHLQVNHDIESNRLKVGCR